MRFQDIIKEKLRELRLEVEFDNKIGQFDINKIVEDVYMHILNDVYGWNLKNANLLKANFSAIDLIDETERIVIQVTSTTDTSKLRTTIEKFKKLDGIDSSYKLKMFYIKDKPNFQKSSLEEFAKNGVLEKDLLGIEDIIFEIQKDLHIGKKLCDTFESIFVDFSCDSNKISEWDKNLYNKFLSELPTSSAINFIYQFNFRNIFKLYKLDELFHFCDKWNNAEHEFRNKELEEKKLEFYTKLDIFLNKLGRESFPTDDKGDGGQLIIQKDNLGNIFPFSLRTVEEINNLSGEVYKLHQEFIRLGREYIYR